MGSFKDFQLFFIYTLCLSSLGLLSIVANEDRKVYIVYMGSASEEYTFSSDQHLGILQQVLEGSNAEESLVRSYGRSFNGFAAELTEKESAKLKSMKGVVSIYPSRTLQLQTTRSWDFMGFPETALRNVSSESDTIVGVIDSGIWPESPSFRDDDFGPPPKKWKGVCNGGKNFTCNNKVIGARAYLGTARDELGHGSHTASTAAGRAVEKASFYGIAEGTARGAVPSARIAVYKVCGPSDSCTDVNIMSAFDDAIADGVDVITISMGHYASPPFDEDSIAIGAFHAMEKGILTLQSAGNEGNSSATVSSVAPWLFSIAASTTDRRIVTKLTLGDGKTLIGNSVINPFSMKGDKFPLIYGNSSSSQCPVEVAKICSCLDKTVVKGKIVVCDSMSGINIALQAGALGAVAHDDIDDVPSDVPLPAVGLFTHEYDALMSYLNSTKAPVGKIFKSETTNDDTNAPIVASFSSRGPNNVASDILKPDITAPGVDILAAYLPIASGVKRSVKYRFLSGTSMSCPHVAGAAAYVKSLHPDWSPAAIKSALMTTARPMSPSKNPDGEFAYGSGHLNPSEAINPGLVYDTDKDDYTRFLCNLGYNDTRIRLISGNASFTCSKKFGKHLSPKDVNYPSLSAKIVEGKPFSVEFQRTVTNVGIANSTYVAIVESRSKIEVTVEPSSLSFRSLKEKKSYSVTVLGEGLPNHSTVTASLVWSDGIHSVRSPIVVYTFTH